MIVSAANWAAPAKTNNDINWACNGESPTFMANEPHNTPQGTVASARGKILQILLELETAETISKIYQLSKIKQRKLVVECLNELTEAGYIEKKKIRANVSWQLTDSGINFAKSLL